MDHAPLRRGVYWGIGRLAAANAAAAVPALPHLVKALEDEDAGIRGMAAFALWRLAGNTPAGARSRGEAAAQWRTAEQALERVQKQAAAVSPLEFFDGNAIVTMTLADISNHALDARKGKQEE